MSKKSQLQVKFEAGIERGLESESAGERTAALKAAADLLNPALGELQTQVKQGEDRLAEAKNSLKETSGALAAANAELATLRPQIERGRAAEAELAELKANFDARVVEMRTELVREAQQQRFASERAERAANATMAEAQSRFGQAGLQLLLDEVKKLITLHNIAEPDAASLPAGISSLYLTLWDHSPIKAGFILAYAKSFPEPSEGFRQQILRLMLAALPSYDSAPQSDPIENRDVKLEVLSMMAQRWPGVLESVQREFEKIQAQRHGQFLINNNIALAAQQNELAIQGYTRDPIRIEQPQSITGCPLSEHILGCSCNICSPGLRRGTSLDVEVA